MNANPYKSPENASGGAQPAKAESSIAAVVCIAGWSIALLSVLAFGMIMATERIILEGLPVDARGPAQYVVIGSALAGVLVGIAGSIWWANEQ